jgi:L-alanine-DL-glutamate epimerase-like enolase superfamily enzyme
VPIEHLHNLDMPFFAIERPLGPREVGSLSQVSLALNRPIILDESLCTMGDLVRFDGAPGQFIANLKVSKVGGICRGLSLIEGIRDRGWPIIVGSHVGESILLAFSLRSLPPLIGTDRAKLSHQIGADALYLGSESTEA